MGYIEAGDTGPWSTISTNSMSTLDNSWSIRDQSDKLKKIYDIPYLPVDELDLSEADFSPSLPRKSSPMEENSNTENGNCFMRENDYTKQNDSSFHQKQEKWKLPIQVADDDDNRTGGTTKLSDTRQHTGESQDTSFTSYTTDGSDLVKNGNLILSSEGLTSHMPDRSLHNSITINKDSPVLDSVDSGCPPEPCSVSPTSPIGRDVIQNGLSFSPPSDDSLEATQIAIKPTHKKQESTYSSDVSNNTDDITNNPTRVYMPAEETFENCSHSENVSDKKSSNCETVIYEHLDLKSESVMEDESEEAVGFDDNTDVHVTEQELAKYLGDESQLEHAQIMTINDMKSSSGVITESRASVDAVDVSGMATDPGFLDLTGATVPTREITTEKTSLGIEPPIPTVIDNLIDATDTKAKLGNREVDTDQPRAPKDVVMVTPMDVVMGTPKDVVMGTRSSTQEMEPDQTENSASVKLNNAIPFTSLASQCNESALSELCAPDLAVADDSKRENLYSKHPIDSELSDSQILHKHDKSELNEAFPDVTSFPERVKCDASKNNEDRNVDRAIAKSGVASNIVSQAGTVSELEAVREFRPKNKSNKKTRPNSLLGLSKVSLDAPISSFQNSDVSKKSLVTCDTIKKEDAIDILVSNNSVGAGNSAILDSRTSYAIVDNDESVINSAHCAELLSEPIASQSFESNVHTVVAPGTEPAVDLPEELDDAPVMRRSVAAANSVPPRPHSWAPESNSTPPPLRNRRPTSLNLPSRSRSDFPAARDGFSAFSLHAQAVEELDENNDSTEQAEAASAAEPEAGESFAPFQTALQDSEASGEV